MKNALYTLWFVITNKDYDDDQDTFNSSTLPSYSLLVFGVSFHSVLRPLESSAQCTSHWNQRLREPLCGSYELQE